jgi:hypothetical protein
MSSLPPEESPTPGPDALEGDRAGRPETPAWAVAPQTPAPQTPAPQVSAGQPPLSQPQYGQPQYGQPQYGQPPYGQPQYGQPPYGQPPYGQPGQAGWAAGPFPGAVRKPAFDRQKWLPTVAVAAIVAAVVLGGLGLDKVIAAPSIGTVDVGNSVTVQAAPGWVRSDNGGGGGGVALQKANAQVTIEAVTFDGSASTELGDVERSISSEAAQISFTEEQDGTIGGRDVAMAGFEAVVSGQSGTGTVDGEVICMSVGGNAVVFVVVTPQGELDQVVDDVKAMVSSVEVGR